MCHSSLRFLLCNRVSQLSLSLSLLFGAVTEEKNKIIKQLLYKRKTLNGQQNYIRIRVWLHEVNILVQSFQLFLLLTTTFIRVFQFLWALFLSIHSHVCFPRGFAWFLYLFMAWIFLILRVWLGHKLCKMCWLLLSQYLFVLNLSLSICILVYNFWDFFW
jgi:hypothetical protein